jgi:hypothetical protein
MKYIYSPQHQGLVEAPLMTDPTFGHYPDYESFEQDFDTYNTWLSSPPAYKVRTEDIEWFSVERGEDEFEVIDSHKWFLSECEDCGWQGSSEKLLGGGALADTGDYGDCYCPKCESRKVEEVNTFPSYEGLVAIPKKRNESKTPFKVHIDDIDPDDIGAIENAGRNESKEQSHEPDFENDPYWIGQAYLQDKQLLEIEKMFDDNGLRLELTCSACPEQYDVFLKVGYLRLRHGEFRVDYPDCGGETIYEAEPNGDGIFNKDERVKYMEEAMKSILKMLNKDHSPTL